MSTQNLLSFILAENQVWRYDGINYRVVKIESGEAKLIALFGSMGFRNVNCQQLLDEGKLLNEHGEIPF